jgi:hypothetical protein
MAHVPERKLDMSNYKEGQVHQLADALEVAGFSTDHITKLGQLGNKLADIRAYLDGYAEIVVTLLSVVGTFLFPATKGKKTKDCFTGEIFGYRDSNLDSLLPENQPDQEAGKFLGRQLSQPATFKQVVENFLGVTGDINLLAKTLKERGHITTLPVIESRIQRQEAGEDVGLTDDWGNFFFVENKNGSVSVVYAFRSDRQWYVLVRRLGYDREWCAGYRFFFRN